MTDNTVCRETHPMIDMMLLCPACRHMAGYIDRPDLVKRTRQRLTPERVLSIRATYAKANPAYRKAKAVLLMICETEGIGYKTATDIVQRRTWSKL